MCVYVWVYVTICVCVCVYVLEGSAKQKKNKRYNDKNRKLLNEQKRAKRAELRNAQAHQRGAFNTQLAKRTYGKEMWIAGTLDPEYDANVWDETAADMEEVQLQTDMPLASQAVVRMPDESYCNYMKRRETVANLRMLPKYSSRRKN